MTIWPLLCSVPSSATAVTALNHELLQLGGVPDRRWAAGREGVLMRRPWRAPAQAAWTGAADVERRGGWLCAGHGERRRRLRGAGGRRRGGGGQPDGQRRRGRTAGGDAG